MKLDKGHYHEICDRSHMIIEMIDQFIINDYEGKAGDKFVFKKANAAIKILGEIYQHAGARF